MMVSIRCNENHFCFSSSQSIFTVVLYVVEALNNLLDAESFINRKVGCGART